MIDNISLSNFKCFESLDLDFSPLTLLTGLNSSGKSSIMQAIRLWQSGELLPTHGSNYDSVSASAKKANIKITIDGTESSVNFSRDEQELCFDPPRNGLSTIHFNAGGILPELRENMPLFSYIAADRAGPQPFLPLSNQKELNSVGIHGEFTVDYLHRYIDDADVPEILRYSNLKNYSGIKNQIQAWLDIISPQSEFNIQTLREADVGTVTFDGFRSTNVGFGLSYSLPIIVNIIVQASLIASKKIPSAIMLIENPEAHLHPRGQTLMGKFIALAASCGIQLIIETHSDHLLNGIRLAIKEKQLSPDDAIFYFFSFDYKTKSSISKPIYCDEHGMLDSWPDGFFDENEKTLMKLI